MTEEITPEIEKLAKDAIAEYRRAIKSHGPFTAKGGRLMVTPGFSILLPIETSTPTLEYEELTGVIEASRKLWVKFGDRIHFLHSFRLRKTE